MRVFISYTSEEKSIAEKLENDLKKQNIAVWIDKKCIKPGELWLKEIDNALYQVEYVLGIITDKYLNSKGADEAYAKISEGLEKRDIKYIPLFFIPPGEVKSVILNAIQGFDFSYEYKKGLLKLIKFLKENEKENARELLTKIESPESPNPFRRVRAEFFFNDHKLLASAFAEPEKEKYDMIRDAKPIIIFGGRGSGKTMILKSLIPEVVISRLKVKKFKNAKKRGINYFGIYFRLKKGSLLIYDYHFIVQLGLLKTNSELDYEIYKDLIEKLEKGQIKNELVLTAGINASYAIIINEINLKILKTTLKNLMKLKDKNIIDIDEKDENIIYDKILNTLNVETSLDKKFGFNISIENKTKNFNTLLRIIEYELRKIEKYIQDLAIPYSTPTPNWCHTGLDFLDEMYEIFTSNINDLHNTHIYLLFDEFENLRPFQQTIINEWIKTSQNFTVKVASKFEGMYTKDTHQGQPLQDGQDYFSWSLDYNLFNKKEKELYQNLLLEICRKLLYIEKYDETDIRKILEEPKEKELSRDIIDEEIKNIRLSANLEFSPEKIKEYRNKLEIAAIFRLLRRREKIEGRKSRKKRYAGFDTFTYLSSGIIRIFLNLIGVSFYIAEDNKVDIKKGEKILLDHQTRSAYLVSKAWLEKISVNIEDFGDIMYQFIVDMGDIFRERLLHHSTEPETLTIRINDPINFRFNGLLNKLFSHSIRESFLCERKESSAMKPKHKGKSQAKEYVINRIYTPTLEISYRPRWPRGSEFTTKELSSLLDYKFREKTKARLQKKQHGKKRKVLNQIISLFKDNEEITNEL